MIKIIGKIYKAEPTDPLYNKTLVDFDGVMIWLDVTDGKVVCEECGEVLPLTDDNFAIIDNKLVCKNCLDTEYHKCELCGKWTKNITLVDGKHLCDKCLSSQTAVCVDCGKRHFVSDMHIVTRQRGLYRVCDYCFENYVRCSGCGNYMPPDELVNGKCAACRAPRVRDYHDNPIRKYYNKKNPTGYDGVGFKGIGIELELDSCCAEDYCDRDELMAKLSEKISTDHVYYMHDGSLGYYGVECITQPHTWEEFNKLDWEGFLEVARDYDYDDTSTTGLHMHISRKFFRSKQALAKMVYFYEKFFDKVYKLSRRGGDHTRWARAYGFKTFSDCSGLVTRTSFNHDDRYRCVNLTNKNTVEVRIMRGTVDYDTFIGSLSFIYGIALRANTISMEDIDSFEAWTKNLNKDAKKLMEVRGVCA